MGVTAALVGASVIGAGASIAGSSMQAKATKDAANQASSTTLAMYRQNRKDMLPWIEAGQEAVNRLSTGVKPGGEFDKFTYSDFYADPSYKWLKNEQMNQVRAGSAATGMFGSGNMGAELLQLSNNLASTEYGNAYNRWMDKFKQVSSIASMGQGSASSLGNMGTSTGNTLASIYTNQGNQMSSIYGGAAAGINNSLQSGLAQYMSYNQNQNMVNALTGAGSGVAGSGIGAGSNAGFYPDYSGGNWFDSGSFAWGN